MVNKQRQREYDNLLYGLELKLTSLGAVDVANQHLSTAAMWFEHNLTLDPTTAIEDRYLSALGYYLSGHYSQAYVLFRNPVSLPEPKVVHSLLRKLFAKQLAEIEEDTTTVLAHPEYSDVQITSDMQSGIITEAEAVERALVASTHRAFSNMCVFIRTGDSARIDRALGLIDICYQIASEAPFLTTTAYPALLQGVIAMFHELRGNSLWTRLEAMRSTDPYQMVERYISAAASRQPPLVELWPSQVVAIPKINEGDAKTRPNFLVKMPTSAGKTNIAELAILRFLIDSAEQPDKKCIYVAPFRELAAQIEGNLQRHFLPLGIGVSDLYGGFEINPTDRFLLDQQRILVATPEKIDALLRYIPDFASHIGLVFIDEGHVIEDAHRGLRFEMLIHRLVRRSAVDSIRIILASAVMGQADTLVHWVTGENDTNNLQTSCFRPTRNYIGLLTWNGQVATRVLTHVSSDNEAGYKPCDAPQDIRVKALPSIGASKFPRKGKKVDAVALAALREARDGMTLVYSPRVDWVELIGEAVLYAMAHIRRCPPMLFPADDLELPRPKLSAEIQLALDRCIEFATEMTGTGSLVTRALMQGFVVHHGDIPEQVRRMLAPLIEVGVFSLIIATNTITNGVNTPVRTVLIHSLVRGTEDNPTQEIPLKEFFNLIGRAGRAMQETEGVALLFTGADQASIGKARRKLNHFVSHINSEELKSALRTFLQRVTNQWQELFPNADVAHLCEALASDRIDWLDSQTQHQLNELDAHLLALLYESDAEATPAKVEELFMRSLVALQAAKEVDPWLGLRSSLNLLTARVEYLAKIPPATRRAFYRTGLSVSDCKILESSRKALLERIGTLGQLSTYSAEQVANSIWRLYHDFLSGISVFTNAKSKPHPCMEQILLGWIQGLHVDEITDLPEVKQVGFTRLQVASQIHEFCSTRMPWALNALRGYIKSFEQNHTDVVDSWLSTWSAMTHFGLPSPKASLFYALGLRSRDAAICCAERCEEATQSKQLYQWLMTLSDDDIQHWQANNRIKLEVVTCRNKLKGISEP